MTVEAATYLSDINATLPLASDGISQGDDHLRLLKATLKATLPALSGPMTATHTQLSRAGEVFGSTPTDKVVHVQPSLVDPSVGGVVQLNKGTSQSTDWSLANFANVLVEIAGATTLRTLDASGNVTYARNVNTTSGKIQEAGVALVPSGSIMMWPSTTAPNGWRVCDGSGGSPDLRGAFVRGATVINPPGLTTSHVANSGSGSDSPVYSLVFIQKI